MKTWLAWVLTLLICESSCVYAQVPKGCSSSEILASFATFRKTGIMSADLRQWLIDSQAQFIAPYKAFDNVWYVGICWVSAWAVRTSDGVVLLDTLHDPFTGLLQDNLKKAGIQPAEIKYVLMTHGHWDHAGGAYALKPLTAARFVMTQRGWAEAAASAGGSRPWKMIAQDLVLKDGESVTVGDTTFTLYETPGHTFGTASYSFPVRDGASTYRAFTVGGLGLNAIRSSKQVEDYIASVSRIERMVRDPADPIGAHLTTHPYSNGLTEAKDRIPGRKASDPHPLVDPEGFLKQLEELRLGAEERLIVERKAGR